MIKAIIGGIGTGKTLKAVKDIIQTNHKVFTNFNVNAPNVTRLKIEHLIKDVVISNKKDGTPITRKEVNWEFWNSVKEDGFSIVLDEVHNILHSRRSMSSWNVLLSTWIAQIRKVLGDHKDCHLILISQKVERIDVSVRDLLNEITYCVKRELPYKKETIVYNSRTQRYSVKKLPKTYIINVYFKGTYCLEAFYNYQMTGEGEDYTSYFYGNDFFKYYDTLELIDFGNDIYV